MVIQFHPRRADDDRTTPHKSIDLLIHTGWYLVSVTIKDIARAAGVSHTTVSRALRGHPAINADTAARIQALADKLGYVPNKVARGLKTSQSGVLGVIVRRIDDPFFGPVLQGIEHVLQNAQYSLLLAASNRDPERERAIAQVMSERRVDGVIICSTQVSEAHRRQLEDFGVLTVLINNQAQEDIVHSIYHDDAGGCRELTDHLIQLGHTRIGYLGNARAGRTSDERLHGYRAALRARDLPVRDEYVTDAANGLAQAGATGVEHFLALSRPPTAIVCYNDVMAIGAMQRLYRAGWHVPHDCSITGFDDIELAAHVNPPLTTFDQPKYDLGHQAAEMMLELLRRKASEDTGPESDIVVLRGKLRVRGSTGPPPS